MRDASYLSLGLTYLLIIFFVLLVMWKKLGLARDTFISSIRGGVQLLAVGYVITWIFKIENTWILFGVIFLMICIATLVSASRAHFFRKLWILLALAIFSSSYISLGLLVLFDAIDWTGKFVIPIGGMIVGQTMSTCSLFMERLLSDIRSNRLMVESNLALGAKPSQAILSLVRQALRAHSIPVLDGLKTLGLIYLPGMMAGLILAGVDPVIAVKYQLIIVLMLVFAYGLSAMILGLLVHLFLFNKNYQLKEL